ncbi:MAG: PPC domain-containing protein [Acidobacteriota bacterium]
MKAHFLAATLLVPALLLGASAGLAEPRGEAPVDPATGLPWSNPYLSFLPTGAKPDLGYWRRAMREAARERRGPLPQEAEPGGLEAAEIEPNDTLEQATPLPGFGTGTGDSSSLRLTGFSTAPPPPTLLMGFAEDDGSIPLAGDPGLVRGGSVRIPGRIGDGPFGSSSGDLDVFAFSGVERGDQIVIDVGTERPAGALDSDAVLYDAEGEILAINQDEDPPSNLDALLMIPAPEGGDFYAMVLGSLFPFLGIPIDPFDSSTGRGVGSLGDYDVTLRLDSGDSDWFRIDLEACDILGASLSGAGSYLALHDGAGELLIASSQDLSGAYPDASPLPGGGRAALHFVAERTGPHFLRVLGHEGADYAVDLRALRQPGEASSEANVLFVDFDGASVNTAIFGASPPLLAELSPLRAFLGRWGLPPTSEDSLIDAILSSLEENIRRDPEGRGPNLSFDLEIRNSRDHPDPFGEPGVSRLIVGGSQSEIGFSTIGIAQSLDPGNFEPAETGVVLLDLLSGPSGGPDSLNSFPLAPGVRKLDFVALAIGNIAAHEAGHFSGNFHTSTRNDAAALMDQGGNLGNTLGVGADGVFGTADDVDVDFVDDRFAESERFAGTESTLTVVSCGYSVESLFDDDFEGGSADRWSSVVP